MKSVRISFIILALLWSAFAGYVLFTARHLPERVATHFSASGQANGWMTRATHVQLTLLISLLVPAFILGIFATIGRFGDHRINLPHKDYWLAPERRAATFAFILRHGVWFAGLFIVFFAGIHYSILTANARIPARLPVSEVGWISNGFTIGICVWVAFLIGHFLRKRA